MVSSPLMVDQPINTFNSTATFSCQTGYNLNGNSQIICQADMNYDGMIPNCTCESIPIMKYTFRSKIKGMQYCFYYKMHYQSCFNSEFLTPVVNCGALPMPTPGLGILTLTQMNTTFDSVGTYSCQSEGYAIVGDEQRTCQADGTYNGTEPTCMCEYN